jgi:hypothetical protein
MGTMMMTPDPTIDWEDEGRDEDEDRGFDEQEIG